MDSHKKNLAAALAAATTALAGAAGAQAATVETVARGLDNPRGVAVAPDGSVYVANTGRAGRTCRRGGEGGLCFGRTGRIVRVTPSGGKSTVADGFMSVGAPGGAFAAGVHGVSVAPDGKVFAVTGSAPPRAVRSMPRSVRRQVGRVFDVTAGNLAQVARVDRLEHAQNLDGVRGDRNSNPYAVLALADRQIVVDAGANAVLQVRDGQVTLLALIPNRRGGRRQSVPSSIALGPDGAYYVGELAESSGRGRARVWRVPAEGGTATVFRSGFTTISGVAFGPDGSLYVTELARSFRTFAGRLVRVGTDGTRTVLAGGRVLKAPTGAAVDSTGAVYVSNFSVLPRRTPRRGDFRGAGGTLVRITP